MESAVNQRLAEDEMKKVLLTATVQSHICQFHRPLVELLHEKGYEVHVAARNNLAEKNGLKLDFVDKVYDIPFARSPKSLDNIKAYIQLKNIIDHGQYSVVHCNTPMGGIVTRLAARKARRKGTKVYYTAHGFHFYKGAPKKNWLVFYPIERIFDRWTDKLITITREDYALAKKNFRADTYYIHGVGVDEERYYPVDEAEKQRLRSELGFSADQKIILCIGELLPNKNQTMAIRMMRLLVSTYPDALLLLAGNGPERENLEKLICETDMQKNVVMLGYCTCLEKYQRIADILVGCSRREGLPLNIVEAMLSANPVIATKNRGHRELVRDGRTGYLVDVDDVEYMAQRAVQLLSDQTERRRMGMCARKCAEPYGFRSVKKDLGAVYE